MYTLWLMPDKRASERLGQLIEDLSQRHESPRFLPHVTLLSGIADPLALAQKKAEKLAQNLGALQASLTKIEYLELYYRCLFFRTDESESLLQARRLAQEIFEHTGVEPFIPHISFLYGSLPVFVKEHIIAQLGERFFMNLCLDELRLVETPQTPESWRVVGVYPLADQGQ